MPRCERPSLGGDDAPIAELARELTDQSLGCVAHWCRYECQSCGSTHAHSLWLKDAPHVSFLNKCVQLSQRANVLQAAHRPLLGAGVRDQVRNEAGEPARVHDPYWGRRHRRLRGDGALRLPSRLPAGPRLRHAPGPACAEQADMQAQARHCRLRRTSGASRRVAASALLGKKGFEQMAFILSDDINTNMYQMGIKELSQSSDRLIKRD